jgi:hypothetical protein
MRLTPLRRGRIRRSLPETSRFGQALNPHEEHMGSITFGNADPTRAIGPALPPDIKINRDGIGRVRVVVATS